MSRLQNILVIKHGAFGDIVISDGALAAIRAHHAGGRITVLTVPRFAGHFARCPHVDAVIADPRAPLWRLDRLWPVLRALRAGEFTHVYDLQNSARSALYRRAMGRVEWSSKADVPEIAQLEAEEAPITFRLKRQLQAAGIAAESVLTPDLLWMAEDVEPLLGAAGVPKRFVALVPGSSAGLTAKRWPYYAELAEALLARGNGVVTAPGPDEAELCGSIPGITLLKTNADPPWLDTFELAGLFARATVTVGNDTGPTHVAAHMGRPVVALFGGHVKPARTGILRDNVTVLEGEGGMDAIALDEVLAAVESRENAPV